MNDEDKKDLELGHLVRQILEKSEVLHIDHCYEHHFMGMGDVYNCAIRFQKDGENDHIFGECVRDALREIAEKLKNGKPVGRLRMPR